MRGFVQRLSKIPVKVFLVVHLVLSFALPLLFLSLNIEKNSPAFFALNLPVMLTSILLAIRFMIYLKAKSSGWYYFFKLYFGFALIGFPAVLFIALDSQFGFKGFLMIPGLALEAGLLIWLYARYCMKRWKKERPVKDAASSSYSFENLCNDLPEGREIEFTYDNVRYLFIPENGRYYFKRITAIDPYEYEILTESGNALVCIDAASINGKKITGIWPDIEDITTY